MVWMLLLLLPKCMGREGNRRHHVLHLATGIRYVHDVFEILFTRESVAKQSHTS
jgi:hypothetical protein